MHRSSDLTATALSELTAATIDDWENLVASSGVNYSLSPGWTKITAKSHRIAEQTEVISVRGSHTLLAVLPIVISRRRLSHVNLRVLDLVSNFVSYHNEPATSLRPDELVQVLLSLARERKGDVVRLAGIPDESGLGQCLSGRLPGVIAQRIPGEISPYLVLPPDWDELLASKPKKFRYKVRKRTEALETSGTLSMAWFGETHQCPDLLHAMEIVENRSWKKDAGISIFEREHERLYHEALLPFLAENRAMFANVLYLERDPIAYNLCCVRNGWVGQLKTSFDTAHSEISPGSMVIDQAIRHAIELGASEFDFLGDQDPHKMAWTKDVRPHSDHFLYLRSSLVGRLIGTGKKMRDRFRKASNQQS